MITPTTESTLRMTLMQLSETKLELTAVTEQRDRLAEALRKVVTSWDEATWLDDNEFESFRDALADVKGGSDE